MAITTPEVDKQAALLRLLTWLSPAFPVGAFSYSHGVERAVHDGVICDRASLLGWLTDLIERGSAWNDAVLLVEAWRGGDVAELAEAMAGSRERHMETMLQGEAFGAAVTAWKNGIESAPYPVVVGQAAAAHGISLTDTLTAYLHAFASNLVQAAMRLVPLGQRDGVATIAALEPVIIEASKRAAGSTLDDLGSSTFLSDVISMKHEIQYSRVFRS